MCVGSISAGISDLSSFDRRLHRPVPTTCAETGLPDPGGGSGSYCPRYELTWRRRGADVPVCAYGPLPCGYRPKTRNRRPHRWLPDSKRCQVADSRGGSELGIYFWDEAGEREPPRLPRSWARRGRPAGPGRHWRPVVTPTGRRRRLPPARRRDHREAGQSCRRGGGRTRGRLAQGLGLPGDDRRPRRSAQPRHRPPLAGRVETRVALRRLESGRQDTSAPDAIV